MLDPSASNQMQPAKVHAGEWLRGGGQVLGQFQFHEENAGESKHPGRKGVETL